MSVVLVVQPDVAQAGTLREICRRIGAEIVIVDSTSGAVDAIAFRVPDLILLSSLLSAREESALMAQLRMLEGASHLQTLNIPQFQMEAFEPVARKSRFSFLKKSKTSATVGCDPAAFAEEIVAHLRTAGEIRSRPVVPRVVAAVTMPAPPAVVESAPERFETEAEADPLVFEPDATDPVPDLVVQWAPEPAVDPAAELMVEPEAEHVAEPMLEEAAQTADLIVFPVEPQAGSAESGDEDEVDRLARQLGLDVSLVEIEEAPTAPVAESEEELYDFGAALDRARNEAEERRSQDLARAQVEADAIREAAIAEARASAEREAREALAIDLARVQAEAQAMRETAIAEARIAAEREARETLDAELARVRSETEVTVADALNRVKLEAEEAERARAEAERLRVEAQEAFTAELARVRAEVEQSLAAQLDVARAEAERMRAAEASAARERTAIEAQLKSEIDRLRFVATQARKADESETRKASEQIKQLEGELATVRARAEERQVAQLEEIRAQMVEMREAAAEHARAAAAEAVASEVARTTALASEATPRLNVIRMQPRAAQPAPAPALPQSEPAVVEAAEMAEAAEQHAAQPRGDYYSLWQPEPAAPEPVDEPEEVSEPWIDFRRHAKWALPVAACLLLVTNRGPAISTVARLMTPAEKPLLIVEPVVVEPFIEVVEKRVGALQIESTPAGAEAVVDGRSYGKTPVTIPNLDVGGHTLVLKGAGGTITRKVTVKANETALVSDAIYSGWLAIFSPIPVTVVVDGKAVSLTDDGRLMAAPGKHVVELISERFNYRATETLEVRPGETTAHTLSVPPGSVRVTAPAGAEIRIDGHLAVGVPGDELLIAVGSHEISATHPDLGERRASVDVRHGAVAEVTLSFEP